MIDLERKAKIEILLSNWGDNLAIAIPNSITKLLQLQANDRVICSIENGKLVLEPVKLKDTYTLSELLAGEIEPSTEVFWGKPEGEEVW